MAYVSRSRSLSSGSQLARGAQAIGETVRFHEGGLTLPALFVRQTATYKFSSRFLVQLQPFDDLAAVAHVPSVRCASGETVKVFTAAPDGAWLDVHVAHEKVPDPTGKVQANGRPATVSVFHRLVVPHRLYAQQTLGLMVGSMTAPDMTLAPIRLINVFIEGFDPKDAQTGQPKGYTMFSPHAGGYILTEGAGARAAWPTPDWLRATMAYERQMLPTRDDLLTDARYKPAPFARRAPADAAPALALALDAASAAAEPDANRLLAPVRLSVDAFPVAGVAEPVFALPSEEYTLAGATAQGMSVVATKIPVWSTRGLPLDPNKPLDNKWRKPRMGSSVVLGVSLARGLDAAAAAGDVPPAKTVAAEVHFYAEHLVNAPSWFLPLHDRIVGGTKDRPPVPFVLVASVNTGKTLLDQRMSDEFPDGLLLLNLVQAPVWRVRDYVQRYCPEVSAETIYGRFAKGQGRARYVGEKDRVESWYDDALEGKTDRVDSSLVRYDKLDSADRCVLLDMCLDELPDADRWPAGTRFYAMPLYDQGVSAPLPRAPSDDDAVAAAAGVPAAARPWRCALATPAAGDAYVRAELLALGRLNTKEQQGTLGDALEKRPGLLFPDAPNVRTEGDYAVTLPYFCFWAVMPADPASQQPVLQPSRAPRAAPAAPVAPASAAPAQQLQAPLLVPKREREPDSSAEDALPPAKVARTADEDDDLIEDFDA